MATKYRIAWDGEPKMGGGVHTISSGLYNTLTEAGKVLFEYEERWRNVTSETRNHRLQVSVDGSEWIDMPAEYFERNSNAYI